jgi:polysaccharide export outer membrane protein
MVSWVLGEMLDLVSHNAHFRHWRHFIGTDNLQLMHMNLDEATYRITRRSGRWRGAVALALALLGMSLTPARAQQQPYLIGPGDVLRISVFKNPDLSIDARVSEAGTLSYPLIGSVSVGGLALPAAERKIADLLREGGFVLNPQVNILTTLALGGLVSVIGEVKTPGRYSIESAGGHLSGMLAVAGGIAPTGSDVVIVTGMRSGKPFRREIDIVTMSVGGNTADDIALSGGDTLFVGRAPQFYIYGQVQKPGQVRLERSMTVMQALAAGGGMTGKGTSRGIVRHRRDASGKVKEEGVSLDEDVRDQDVIYVKESLF